MIKLHKVVMGLTFFVICFTQMGVVIVGSQAISLLSFLLSRLKLEGRKPPEETDPIVLLFLNILKWDQRNKAALVNPATCKNTKEI